MSDLSHTATVDTAPGDHSLVRGLRERHVSLSARDSRAKPFELRLPDRTAPAIGGEGEPAFTVRIVTDKGLAADLRRAPPLRTGRARVIARWGKHLYRRFVLYPWSAANSCETGSLSAHHMILQLPSPGGAPRAAMESWS
jgi:hypothetical protein